MNRVGLVALVFGFSALTAFFVRQAPPLRAQAQPYQPLEGTLFKGKIEALEKADVPLPSIPKNAPSISVFVRNPGQLGLDANAEEFVGKIVPESGAKAELSPVSKKPIHYRSHKPQTAVHAVESTPAPSPAQLSVPERMMTFSTMDAALNASDAAFPLKSRFQKGGVTLQLTQIGKWNGFYLLKYSLTNEEEREFFISSVQLTLRSAAIPSESFVPFSCLPHNSIMGIVKFPIDGTAGKSLSVDVEESGGRYTKLEIKDVDYKF